MQKLIFVGWILLLTVVSGLGAGLPVKPLHGLFSVVHKLCALVCLVVVLLRITGVVRHFESRPAIVAAIAVFAVGFVAAFVSGVIQSIPTQASALWLNSHRISATVAFVACVIAWRLMVLNAR